MKSNHRSQCGAGVTESELQMLATARATGNKKAEAHLLAEFKESRSHGDAWKQWGAVQERRAA